MPIRIKLVGSPDKLSDRIREQLEYLDRTCFPEDAPYPKDGCHWWIAYDGPDPVAFAGLKPLKSKHNRGIGFLCRAGVLPRANGNGLQRRLIGIRIRRARAIGLKQVVTYTSRTNFRSAANLLRAGMRFYSPATYYGVPGALYFNLHLT